jgi:hypothetical protein
MLFESAGKLGREIYQTKTDKEGLISLSALNKITLVLSIQKKRFRL